MWLLKGIVSIFNFEEILRKRLESASRNILFLAETSGSRQLLSSSHFQKVLGFLPQMEYHLTKAKMDGVQHGKYMPIQPHREFTIIQRLTIWRKHSCNSANPASAFLRLVFFTPKSMSWMEDHGETDF